MYRRLWSICRAMKSNAKILVVRYLLWSLALAIMVLIFAFSSKTAEQSSESSGSFAKTLLSIAVPGFTEWSETEQQTAVEDMQFIVRKGAHFAIFFTLGSVCLFAMNTYNVSTKRKFIVSLLIPLLYAISDEIHQLFVPGRAGQIRDVLIDFTGAASGVTLSFAAITVYKKIRKKRDAA